jgi:hypothetical protein
LTHGFTGEEVDGSFLTGRTLLEDADIAEEMKLTPNKIEGGCELEDGSVVVADTEFSREKKERTLEIEVSGHKVKASYKGVFAIKLDKGGKLQKAACGDCAFLQIDGEKIIETENPTDIFIIKE